MEEGPRRRPAAAGDKDLRVGGGIAAVRAFLATAPLDEMDLAIARLPLGARACAHVVLRDWINARLGKRVKKWNEGSRISDWRPYPMAHQFGAAGGDWERRLSCVTGP